MVGRRVKGARGGDVVMAYALFFEHCDCGCVACWRECFVGGDEVVEGTPAKTLKGLHN